ncbi:LysR family transcriptional regulator [Rhizobium sp. ICMP 5592]|uniref:LysR family transcriptional regulator n=1 Tax=Rhizobium sp. ICMP 5592 TaxID=2292445 RepID=UPI0012974A22|nr:LysR family transcriptional regulator [Rhizobium sp. ICMP 5592]MQB46476.1 LysR family transcriptional regulator [Rhizobium sp. ICMP 5592]
MNNFSIGQLEAFRWTAELGSVQKAADRLHVTQPSLSLRLKQLESEAEAPLFERYGRGLRLTRHGQAFLSRTRIVLDAYDDLRRVSGVPEIAGTLRIGVAEGFAVASMASLIPNLQRSFPLLRPEWTVATSSGLEQQLADGELDVAILVEPIGLREVRLFALGTQTNSWAVSTDTYAGVGLRATDLSKLTIITTPPPTAMYRATLGWFAEGKITPPNVCLCSSLNAALQLVAAGLGAGIFPTKMIEAYPLAGAIRTLKTDPVLREGRVFVADRATSDEARTQALIRIVEDTARSLRYFEP